jgi:Ca2+/H+ antiporter
LGITANDARTLADQSAARDGRTESFSSTMYWLLLFIPAAVGLEWFAPEQHLPIFITSSLAILPLAWWMGRATEELADRLGDAIGGF